MIETEELLMRLRNLEDQFVERKSHGDSKDWLKTIVAFANSTPIGYPALLFIGVRNDGTIEQPAPNWDSLQIKLMRDVAEAYPPIYCLPKILETDHGSTLCVIVPGSENRPHFSGPAFIRRGSKTEKASDSMFDQLIAERTATSYEVLKWKGKTVSLHYEKQAPTEGRVIDCNKFWISFKAATMARISSYPLSRVELSYDHRSERLRIEIRDR